MNDEILEQVIQITYLGFSISYHFSNDIESKLAKFLQLVGTIKRTIFRIVRTETILKIYSTLVLRTFLYGSENLTQRRRIEAAEMKLLRPLAGHTLYDHKTNDYYVIRELQIKYIFNCKRNPTHCMKPKAQLPIHKRQSLIPVIHRVSEN